MTRTSRKRLRALTVAALVAALGVFVPQAWTKQKAEAFPLDSLSFGSNSHGAMTRTAVRQFLKEVYNITTPTAAQENAIFDIGLSNEAVDVDQITSAKHFDGENFTGAKNLIIENLNSAVIWAHADLSANSRANLGTALHTIQDFYAHTNWVELGKTTINPNLYNGKSIGTVAGPTEPTCDIIDGGFLITTKLTSGYYGGQDRTPKIIGKCRHGGPTDFGPGFGGINKDFNTVLSPHFALHAKASDLAIKASVQFLKDFRLKVNNEAKTMKVFRIL